MTPLIEGRTGQWETVIGLEVHAQIVSKAKLFSGAATAFGAEPNTQVSPVDAAFPGMLPVINRRCVEQAVKTGLGLDAEINLTSVFDRKNYFYPDLPAGYQISQYLQPVVGQGRVVLDMPDGSTREIGITRLHLEQDAGKSLHDQHPSLTYVDLNRAGVGLMEIVSEPDLRSAEEAGHLSAQAALDPALSRHLRRQHGGGLDALRRQRLGAPSGRALRHALRDQERQLGALCDAGDRVRGAPPGRVARGRRQGGAADPLLRCRARRHPADALQGGGARLPLFPRSRPLAVGARSRLGRGAARGFAGIARRQEGAVRRGARPHAGGCRRCWSPSRRAPLFFERVAEGRDRQGGGQLGHRRSVRRAEPARHRDRAVAGVARATRRADRPRSPTARSPAGSPRTCSPRWSRPAPTPPRSSSRRACARSPTRAPSPPRSTRCFAAQPDKVAEYRAGRDKLYGFFVGQIMRATQGKANPALVNEMLRKKLTPDRE